MLLFISVLTSVALAQLDTTQVSGNVSGVWSDSLGPYAVVGEVTVPAGETLVIEPGVEVRFRGPYHFTVNGVLKALGTENDSIIFTRDSAIEGHKWKGIRFDSCQAGCSLMYCRIEYVKNDGAYPEVRGGAVYCRHASPVVSHCALCHNYSHNANANGGGGGVFVEYGSPVVEYCHIFDNYVDSGGGLCTLEECAALFLNNVIEDNTATYSGGGMYLGVRSGPTATGNIIRRNRCAGGWGGGGIYVLNEGQFLPDVANCIVYDNVAANGPSVFLDNANNSRIYLNWSDVEGGWEGAGNFDSVPNFRDTVEFHLQEPSHCIDAGTSDNTPDHDFEGDDRNDHWQSPNRGGGQYPYYDVGWDEYTETGIEESHKPQAPSYKLEPTIVRDVLFLGGENGDCPAPSPTQALRGTVPCFPKPALLDISGRKVLDLHAGANDVSGLTPGVYFLTEDGGRSTVHVRRLTLVR